MSNYLISVTRETVDKENNYDVIRTMGNDQRLRRPEGTRKLEIDKDDEESQFVSTAKYFAKLASVAFLFLMVLLTCLFSKLFLILTNDFINKI